LSAARSAPAALRALDEFVKRDRRCRLGARGARSRRTSSNGLFDARGRLLLIREDVGRHSALDKVIGAALLSGALLLAQRLVLVSGRASFELVQKATQAGVSVLAAVGAPSSLAAQLAQECGMTLLGLVRDNHLNVYAARERIVGLR
jgi:FdhD protein